MTELTINGIVYRTGRMSALDQFHVGRRLAPVIARIGALNETSASDNGVDNGSTNSADDGRLFTTLTEAVSSMSDDECNYVIRKCMAVVARQQGDRYAPVWNRQADRFQFDDIDMPSMLQLTIAVIQDNLSGFTLAPVQTGNPSLASLQNAR